MTKTTLRDMQLIEAEAEAVHAVYLEKLNATYDEMKQQLSEELAEFDNETQRLVNAKKEEGQEQVCIAEGKLQEALAHNQARIDQALQHKKDDLIKKIIEEVVIRYGN